MNVLLRDTHQYDPTTLMVCASSPVTLGAFSTFPLLECCECSIDMSRTTWLLIIIIMMLLMAIVLMLLVLMLLLLMTSMHNHGEDIFMNVLLRDAH